MRRIIYRAVASTYIQTVADDICINNNRATLSVNARPYCTLGLGAKVPPATTIPDFRLEPDIPQPATPIPLSYTPALMPPSPA